MDSPDPLDRLVRNVPAWNARRARGPLAEVDLRGADLRGLDLRGVDLWYARLDGARLDGAILAGAVLDRVDLTEASLCGAQMHGVRMRSAIVERTSLRGTCLAEAELSLTRFVDVDLDAAVFTGATLLGVSFAGCDLDGALGLDPAAGWRVVEDDPGAGKPRPAFGVDRRGALHGRLRGVG